MLPTAAFATTPLLLLVLLLTTTITHVLAQTCYFASGKTSTDFSPCDITVSVSHCCAIGDVCLGNGLCFATGANTSIVSGTNNGVGGGWLYRGGCSTIL